MEEDRSGFKILKSKLTRKRLLGRHRHRWEDNIRMDLRETGVETRNWIDLAHGRNYCIVLVNTALNIRVP
jgi:hypothetical protein